MDVYDKIARYYENGIYNDKHMRAFAELGSLSERDIAVRTKTYGKTLEQNKADCADMSAAYMEGVQKA